MTDEVGDPVPPTADPVEDGSEITSSELLTIGMDVVRDLDQGGVSDDVTKRYLDEVLVLLIAARDGANGKQLLHDLIRLFDANLSSGTVYPRLHALKEEDVLTCHERKRTKEYHVESDVARHRLDRTVAELRGVATVMERLGDYVDSDER
jgi:hypothetical protein